jgi:predicted acyltransferase
MILVNNSGDSQATYWPLLHQPWDGTPTDLIFPFFLWSRAVARLLAPHRLSRCAVALGQTDPARPARQLHDRRLRAASALGGRPAAHRPVLPGRVGRAPLALDARRPLAVVLLVGYWTVMTRIVGPEGYAPNLEPRRASNGEVDRIVLDGSLPVDEAMGPGGVLSHRARDRDGAPRPAGRRVAPHVARTAAEGGWLVVGNSSSSRSASWGEAARRGSSPSPQNLWSRRRAAAAGLATTLFGLVWWIVDVRGVRGWTGPFVTYGKNAISVYVASEVFSERQHDPVGRVDGRP